MLAWFLSAFLGIVASAVLCGMAFIVAVGMGFGKITLARQRFVEVILKPGTMLAPEPTVARVGVSGLFWAMLFTFLLRGIASIYLS